MLQQALMALFKGHGLEAETYKDWIVVGGQLPAMAASIHNLREQGNSTFLQLDVEVAVSADELIVESFSGSGEDEAAAVGNALQNFCINSLHVFLAAFWGHVEEDQVSIEDWQIESNRWRAVIGNIGCKSVGGEAVALPDDFFPTLETSIKALSLTGERHWVRSFYGNIDGEETCTEVLLDNEVWPEAQAAIAALDWPRSDGYYSARNFLILQRA